MLSIRTYLLCATVVASPYLAVMLADYYVPGNDEAFQFEAAIRLAAGQGYTASPVVVHDLAAPTFEFLIQWPIGYSALIAGLLTIGIPLVLAAKLIKLSVVMMALAAWSRFAAPFLQRPTAAMAFCGFLGFFVAVRAGWMTDLFLVALFPVFSQWMLTADAPAGTPGGAHADRWRLLAAGTLAGLLVVMKYSALPFVALGAAWIVWRNRRYPRAAARDACVFGLPAAGIAGALFLINYLNSGAISASTEGGIAARMPGWREWIVHAGRAAFFDAPYVPMVAVRELSAAFGVAPGHAMAAASIAIMGAAAASIVVLLRRGGRERTLALWVTAAFVTNLLYLALTTALYFPAGGWTPLMEGRYFIWLAPGIVLCVLTAAGGRLSGRDPRPLPARTLAAVILAGSFAAGVGYAAYIHRVAGAFQGDTQAMQEAFASITASLDHPPVAIFLDSEHFRTFHRSGRANVFAGPAAWLDNASFSRPTMVAMICSRVARLRSEEGRSHCADQGFDRIAARHRFAAVEVGARDTLYWRLFAAAPAE